MNRFKPTTVRIEWSRLDTILDDPKEDHGTFIPSSDAELCTPGKFVHFVAEGHDCSLLAKILERQMDPYPKALPGLSFVGFEAVATLFVPIETLRQMAALCEEEKPWTYIPGGH